MNPLNGARAPVPQTIVWRIQEMIASGEIKPGDRLPSQRELSLQFNISRASLREALSVLETLGSIRIDPGRGAVVCADGSSGGWRFGSRIPKEDGKFARTALCRVVDRYGEQWLTGRESNMADVVAWRSHLGFDSRLQVHDRQTAAFARGNGEPFPVCRNG